MRNSRPALKPITENEIMQRIAAAVNKHGYDISPEAIRSELNSTQGDTQLKKLLLLTYTVVVFQLIIIEQQLEHSAAALYQKTKSDKRRSPSRPAAPVSPAPEPRPRDKGEKQKEEQAEKTNDRVARLQLRLEHALTNFAKLTAAVLLLAHEHKLLRRAWLVDNLFPHLDSSMQLNPDEVYSQFENLMDPKDTGMAIMRFGGNLNAQMLQGLATQYSAFQLKLSRQAGKLNEQFESAAATVREVREDFENTLHEYKDLGGQFTPGAPLLHPRPSARPEDLPPSYEEATKLDHINMPPRYEEIFLHQTTYQKTPTPGAPSPGAPTPKPPGTV